MQSKTQMRAAKDYLESNGCVVTGAVTEPVNALRVIIDEDDESQAEAVREAGLNHMADVEHEGTAGGHDVYQLVNNNTEKLDF